MSTIKISELTPITTINSNTGNTFIVGTDASTGVTGKITATALANGLYANNTLNVGNNAVLFPGVIGQFASNNANYLQLNVQNLNGNGSSDLVATADTGTDTIHFIDVGIQGSNLTQGVLKPLDGYLLVQGDGSNPGGNLIIGSLVSKDIIFAQGGFDPSNVVAKFVPSTGLQLTQKPLTFADGTTQNTSSASAGTSANAAFIRANTPHAISNSAALYANGAFAKANAALANASGTLAGSLVVTGSVTSSNISLTGDASITYSPSASPATLLFTAPSSGFTGNVYAPKLITDNLLVIGTSTVTGNVYMGGVVTMNARTIMANSNFTATEAAVTIKATANTAVPSNDGYMLHISGKQNVSSRIVFDSYSANGAAYGLIAGRTARGNVDYPEPVQSGDVLMRISGNGYGTSEFAPLGIARIDIIATETYTNSSRGSQIKFYNIENGSNTLVNIATFNANNVTFSGYVNPAKGVVYTPRLPAGPQTAITIDYTSDSVIKANCAADVTISHSNYVAGKVVEVWLINTDNSNHTVTHGCAALRSTNKSTTATITAGSSMYLRFFSIDGDNANTFVSING